MHTRTHTCMHTHTIVRDPAGWHYLHLVVRESLGDGKEFEFVLSPTNIFIAI